MAVTLLDLGFDAFFEQQLGELEAGAVVGRVVAEEMVTYRVRVASEDEPEGAEGGEFWADLAGKFRHRAGDRTEVPAVGDFVVIRPPHSAASRGMVLRMVPRRSLIARTTERGAIQPLAANIDTAFITTSANAEFNPRRVERYLALVHKSGALPVVVVTKADLAEDVGEFVEAVAGVAPGVACHAVSAVAERGLELLEQYLGVGKTVVLLGSSGVGKSTLANYLARAELQFMMEIREFDDKGRHCTSRRNLFMLPADRGGGLLIDTPGLRGLSVTESTDALAMTFEDIAELAGKCKFGNCGHESEPGCAVKAAIAAGTLDAGRVAGYVKMQRELAYQSRTKADIQRTKEAGKRKKK